MQETVSIVILSGDISDAPEFYGINNGEMVCEFHIDAANISAIVTTNSELENIVFYSVSIIDNVLVRNTGKYLQIGTKVHLEGRLESIEQFDINHSSSQPQDEGRYAKVVIDSQSGKLLIDNESRGNKD